MDPSFGSSIEGERSWRNWRGSDRRKRNESCRNGSEKLLEEGKDSSEIQGELGRDDGVLDTGRGAEGRIESLD